MNETTIKAMWVRKLAGEKTADLAREMRLNKQQLVSEWKKLGMYKQETTETTTETTETPVEAEIEAAKDNEVLMPEVAMPETTPEPKPAKKAKPTFAPELVAQAVELKRAGAKWSEVGKLLGCSWNFAWGVVASVAPELCNKKK